MKKWGWKKFAVIGMTLTLAFSSTAFASELDVIEETEKEQNYAAENDLTMKIFKMEKEAVLQNEGLEGENSQILREMTMEELEKGNIQSDPSSLDTEKVFIVFQREDLFAEKENETETAQPAEEVFHESSEEDVLPQQTENMTSALDEVTTVLLTEEQEEQVIEAASYAFDTVVVMNGRKLQDEMIFKDQKNIKAVLNINEKTEKGIQEALTSLDYEQLYADYQAKAEQALKEEAEFYDKDAKSTLPGQDLAGTQTPDSNGGNSSTSGTTTQKEIVITMVPDLLEEEDDGLYTIYELSAPDDVKISEANFTLTYDSTKMSYDKDYSEAGEDASEDFTYNVTDNNGKLQISLKSKDNTSKNLKGSILDLGFELKSEAKVGDTFNLNLEVSSLKDGTKDLKTDTANYKITVKQETLKAVAYEDEESESETQSESQTQAQTPQPQTQTQAPTPELQKAAKTGDSTNMMLWIGLMAVSIGAYAIIRKKEFAK